MKNLITIVIATGSLFAQTAFADPIFFATITKDNQVQPLNWDTVTKIIQDAKFRVVDGNYGYISGSQTTCYYSYLGFTGYFKLYQSAQSPVGEEKILINYGKNITTSFFKFLIG